jgi:hypothetical protein
VRVAITIDRLLVNGLELSRWDRAALGPAIQRELALVVRGGAGDAARRPRPARAGTVDRIAREVAVAVHGAIGTSSPRGGGR